MSTGPAKQSPFMVIIVVLLWSVIPRMGRSVQYSEDSETGDGQRKRFRLSRDEEEMDAGIGDKKKKKKKKSWADQEQSTSQALEVGCINPLLATHFYISA